MCRMIFFVLSYSNIPDPPKQEGVNRTIHAKYSTIRSVYPIEPRQVLSPLFCHPALQASSNRLFRRKILGYVHSHGP